MNHEEVQALIERAEQFLPLCAYHDAGIGPCTCLGDPRPIIHELVLALLEASRPRLVETVEQLDALPLDAVIRSTHGAVLVRDKDDPFSWTVADETQEQWTSSGVWDCYTSPFRVLFVPVSVEPGKEQQ